MKYLILLVIPLSIFIASASGRWLLGFALDNQTRWWGGLPLWMTGFMCLIVPLAVIGVLGPMAILAFHK